MSYLKGSFGYVTERCRGWLLALEALSVYAFFDSKSKR
jgi:hypothetical protein